MNYQEFLNYIKENFLDFFIPFQKKRVCQGEMTSEWKEKDMDDYVIEIHQVIKNNGVKLDGLVIRKKQEFVSPNIYLNSYFEMYQMGMPINSIMEELAKQYMAIRKKEEIKIHNILDFNELKNHIIIRLVNYEKNRELLMNSPYKRFLDLAVTFRYMANHTADGLASSLIGNDEFLNWGIDEEELYRIALFNTMREFPWHMESLAKIIINCLKKSIPQEEQDGFDLEELEREQDHINMFVLSNESALNGASCMLYDSVIRNFAKVQGKNIIILPSSIHEVILVPEQEDTDIEFLQNLVIDANKSAVGLIDLLSDSIYYYQLEKDEITIYGKSITSQN